MTGAIVNPSAATALFRVLLCLWLGAGAGGTLGVSAAEPSRHWAFQPVTHPEPPQASKDSWSRGEIDRFVFARLQESGLKPSAPADRRTLIRRATFDLLGLPPSADEVEAFVRDPDPDAFAHVVDRLLASPQYGEQWARHWLDLARYSDTKGYVYGREESRFVHAWPYRDWVVRSLNDDVAYDRFLLLQLAADQLVPEGSGDLAAMGFLTLGRRFLGVAPDILDDRIDVVMRTTQGLTVACARCHDHKFDPIPTTDYYALYGVFKNCAEKLVRCGPESPDAEFNRELRSREQKLAEAFSLRREDRSARARALVTEYLLAQLELDKYPGENFSQILGADDLNPVFVRRWQASLEEAARTRDPVFAAWHEFAGLPGKEVSRHVLSPAASAHPRIAEAFRTPPSGMREVAERYGRLFLEAEREWRERVRQDPSATSLPDPADESLRAVLHGPRSPCTVPDEHLANTEWFFHTDLCTELWKFQGEVDRWLIQSPSAPAYATILVDRDHPMPGRVFKRGNPLTPGAEVPRRFLTVLAGDAPAAFTRGSGRLELARAIASPDNPLTARVMVNRVWQHHFGRGLVDTPSDFGKRATPPSHPALLDWLSARFIREGWSLKRLHRRILLSAAWQQSSLAPQNGATARKAQEIDPDNRLLWRMNSHRLTFEEMRDAWLAATRELDLRAGGKPSELFDPANRRRTLYTRVDRETLPAVMRTFDFANPDLCIAQRNDTIVPQQALFGLNHPFVAARARRLAAETAQSAREDRDRVRELYARLFQRPPGRQELANALDFVRSDPPPSTTASFRPESRAWQYGYGELDEPTGRLRSFTPLPHFNGSAWQGGERFPDDALGWAQLTAKGGHPGNDRRHAVVRRWTAPRAGTYAVNSTLVHEPEVGDGIRAFVSHPARGLLKSAIAHHASATLDLPSLDLAAGDTLDFIVDIRDGLNSDQFLWAPRIQATAGGKGSWDAERDFQGPAPQGLDAWEQLAQTLMLANEFVFVD